MWLYTRYGFFSVSVKGQTAFIRARNQLHLKTLMIRFKSLINQPLTAIQKDAGTDYAWRVGVPKEVYVKLATELAEEQTWGNFKGEVKRAGITDETYEDLLHRIWYDCLQYQARCNFVVVGELAKRKKGKK